ncbi:hypothetical protein AAFF_G00205660 [Aldrovandia affinis]|uniref:DDE Tnp4 domain-containing protein n=1 Tax=Aldrovandia affinis TaxID=143900 RepID=A0AAD7W5S6_9TELE|nr:hypothetical protein AAFF_G00205660 [Aldrovandia affinis]
MLLFERHRVPTGCHLVGDSGYPSRTWLLTPYIHPQPGPQSNYNRGIGQLKRRFHVLHGEIRLTPEKASRVITVCAILHNLCKQRNIPQPEEEEEEEEDDDDNGGGDAGRVAVAVQQSGVAYRAHYTNTHFG